MSLETLKIKQDEIAKMGVSSLPTRPNAPVISGGQGLTPSQMRARFDALPKHIADRFNELIDKLTSADGAYSITALKGSVTDLDGDIESINNKIENLVLQSPDGIREELDEVKKAQQTSEKILADYKLDLENFKTTLADSVADVEDSYSSRSTADGLNIYDNQNTFVKRIEGASVASANILPLPSTWYNTVTNKGVTFTVNKSAGEITLNGTASESGTFVFSSQIDLTAGNYIIDSNIGSNLMGDLYKDGAWNKSVSKSFTVDGSGSYKLTPYIIFSAGATFDNVVFRPYLQRGTTAKPWNKPFKGLQMAKIDRIVSTGRNLFKAENIIKGSFDANGGFLNGEHLLRTGTPISVISGATYTVSCDPSYDLRFLYFYGANNGYISNTWMGRPQNLYYTFTVPNEAVSVNIGFEIDGASASTNVSADEAKANSKMRLVYGQTSLPYEPYIESTYQLPQTVELGEYDHIDIEEGKIYRYTQRVHPSEANTIKSDLSDVVFGFNIYQINLSVRAYEIPFETELGYPLTVGEAISSKHEYRLDEPEFIQLGEFQLFYGTEMYFASNAETVDEFLSEIRDDEIVYRTANPISVEEIEIPKFYKAWNGGTETIFADNDTMNEYAHPTIAQEYLVKGAIE